jgi:hypothetical protein
MSRRPDPQEVSPDASERFWWALNNCGREDQPAVGLRASRLLVDLVLTGMVDPNSTEWGLLRMHLRRVDRADLVRLEPWMAAHWGTLVGLHGEGDEPLALALAQMGGAGATLVRRFLAEGTHVASHAAVVIPWTAEPEIMALPDVRATLIALSEAHIAVAEALVPVVGVDALDLEAVLAPWWGILPAAFDRLLARVMVTPHAALVPDRLLALATSPDPRYREAAVRLSGR